MTSEQLQEILNKVWMRDWSADDAFEAIWLEKFEEKVEPIEYLEGTEIEESKG